MDFVGLILLILSFVFFVVSSYLISTHYEYGFPVSGVVFLFFAFVLLCLGIIAIWITFRFYLKKLGKEHFLLSKFISHKYIKAKEIVFRNDKNVWATNFTGKNIGFNLHGLFFKKEFVIAFVVRAIRYNLVSNKLPIAYLGRFRLNGFSASTIFEIVFVKKTSIKRINLLKKGYSICRLIPYLIIKSKLPPMFERHRSIKDSIGNVVFPIDEEKYITFY